MLICVVNFVTNVTVMICIIIYIYVVDLCLAL